MCLSRIREAYGSERRGRALFFACCAQETVGFSIPIDPTVTRLQVIFIFYVSLHDLATIDYGKLKDMQYYQILYCALKGTNKYMYIINLQKLTRHARYIHDAYIKIYHHLGTVSKDLRMCWRAD